MFCYQARRKLLYFSISCCAAGILSGPGASFAGDSHAVLSIPGSSLVFSGLGLQALDNEGHFAIGVKLPQPGLKTTNCDTEYLVIGMGTLNKDPGKLTEADKRIIARNQRYYEALREAALRGDTVNISVRNTRQYLKLKQGVLVAPYCILSIDQDKAP